MANEEDDYFGDDDDLDEETLLVLEQAEKQHAAVAASQAPAISSNTNALRAASVVPVKAQVQAYPQRRHVSAAPLPSQLSRPLNPSQQQRATSTTARPQPYQQVNHASAVPPSQHQKQQQKLAPILQQANRTVPSSQYGSAVAGPSTTSTYVRKVVKPVYRDDFPPVEIDETGNRYKPRNVSAHSTTSAAVVNGTASRSAVDTEKEELKRQLAEVC